MDVLDECVYVYIDYYRQHLESMLQSLAPPPSLYTSPINDAVSRPHPTITLDNIYK